MKIVVKNQPAVGAPKWHTTIFTVQLGVVKIVVKNQPAVGRAQSHTTIFTTTYRGSTGAQMRQPPLLRRNIRWVLASWLRPAGPVESA